MAGFVVIASSLCRTYAISSCKIKFLLSMSYYIAIPNILNDSRVLGLVRSRR